MTHIGLTKSELELILTSLNLMRNLYEQIFSLGIKSKCFDDDRAARVLALYFKLEDAMTCID